MKRVAVIGTGMMGSGIAHSFALNNYIVYFFGRSSNYKDKFLCYLENEVKSNRVNDEEKLKILNNIKFLFIKKDYKELKQCELIIETVKEDIALKKEIFKEIEQYVTSEAIVATNTSTYSINELSGGMKDSSKFIGMHFVSPVPVLGIVEVVKGLETSNRVIEKTREIVESINKKAYVVKDYPGFVMTRLFVPYINEAIYTLNDGVIETPKELDDLMKGGFNYKVGPLKLADIIGLDTIYCCILSLYEQFKDSKYRPCPLLKRMVDAGMLGRKSGKGFYTYE